MCLIETMSYHSVRILDSMNRIVVLEKSRVNCHVESELIFIEENQNLPFYPPFSVQGLLYHYSPCYLL
jgi:hypothetical protein